MINKIIKSHSSYLKKILLSISIFFMFTSSLHASNLNIQNPLDKFVYALEEFKNLLNSSDFSENNLNIRFKVEEFAQAYSIENGFPIQSENLAAMLRATNMAVKYYKEGIH